MNWRCLVNGHRDMPRSRWVRPDYTLSPRDAPDELWVFRICTRCQRLVGGRDSGKRWNDPLPWEFGP